LSQDPNLQDSNLFLPVILPATSALLAFINNALAHHFGITERQFVPLKSAKRPNIGSVSRIDLLFDWRAK
jgi:hypothetical protein